MKFAVLGAGMVGKAIVYDLSRREDVSQVKLADCHLSRATDVAGKYGHNKTLATELDISDEARVRQFISGCDVALGAVSYRFNESLTRACIGEGVHFVDLGGNNDVVNAQFALSDMAVEKDVSIVPDCGIAPGAVSIFAARLLEIMPDADSVTLRVGGLPLEPVPPFNYQIVFSVEGLVNEYKEPTVALKDGEIISVPSMAELEDVVFPPPFGTLEAFNTSGGSSTLPYTFKDRLKNLNYKTLRYPGHCQLINALFALGLAGEEDVEVDGVSIIPRRFLQKQLEETLSFQGKDVILSIVQASGPSGTVGLRIMDQADDETGLSAMARCTAFPATTIAYMLATGIISKRGTLKQEESIPAAEFIERVRSCGIAITLEKERCFPTG